MNPPDGSGSGTELREAIAQFLRDHQLLDLSETRKAGTTNGGEYAGPCPSCGGSDRWRAWPDHPEGSSAWCRQCGRSGDVLAWTMLAAGRDPKEVGETAQYLRNKGYLREQKADGQQRKQQRKLSQAQRGVNKADGKPGKVMPLDLVAAVEGVTPERAAEVLALAVRDFGAALTPGSPAAEYLNERGIPLAEALAAGVGVVPDDDGDDEADIDVTIAEMLAVGLAAWSGNTGRPYPRWFRGHRLVVPAFDAEGTCTGIILRAAGPVKDNEAKELSPPKGRGEVRVLGLDAFGVNRHPDLAGENPVVLVAEGTPDYLTGRCALNLPTLGIPGTSRWQSIREHRVRDLIPEAATIVVALDAEESARKASARLWDALKLAPHRIVVVEPRDDGADLNDLLLAHGAENLRTAVLELARGDVDEGSGLVRISDDVLDERFAELNSKPGGDSARTSRSSARTGDPGRTVYVSGRIGVMVDRSISALALHDDDAFQRGGELVHVVRADGLPDGIRRSSGATRIRAMSTAHLRERLSRVLDFYKPRKGHDESVPPPNEVAQAIATRGFLPGIRELAGVVDVPVLRPDGTVNYSPGYDATTGLLYEPGCDIPTIPANPTREDAAVAATRLLELVGDFPFATDAHRSAWLAGLLTIMARHTFNGCAPMFLLDANTRGSGKSLLADVLGTIATGRPMARFSAPGDDDEMRKRITSIAIAGDSIVLIDNVNTALGGASLDAALTGTVWRDRILGKSELVELPLHVTWFATGNNVQLRADTSRRACHIRLESPHERPEDRADFQHADLLAHAAEHRGEYVAAALTLLAAYCRAGRPDQGLRPWGSFTGWSGLVRGAIVWVGLPDPGETRLELQEAADVDAQALTQLIHGWGEVDPDGDGVSAAELAKVVNDSPDSCPTVASAIADLCGRKIDARSIGYRLRKFRGRVVRGVAIASRKVHGGKAVWLVESTTSPNEFNCHQTSGGGDGCDGCDVSPTPARVTPARARTHAREPDRSDRNHRNHHNHDATGTGEPLENANGNTGSREPDRALTTSGDGSAAGHEVDASGTAASLHKQVLRLLRMGSARQASAEAESMGADVFAVYTYAVKRSTDLLCEAEDAGRELSREEAELEAVADGVARRAELVAKFDPAAHRLAQ